MKRNSREFFSEFTNFNLLTICKVVNYQVHSNLVYPTK
jgi:hypothetical protein